MHYNALGSQVIQNFTEMHHLDNKYIQIKAQTHSAKCNFVVKYPLLDQKNIDN